MIQHSARTISSFALSRSRLLPTPVRRSCRASMRSGTVFTRYSGTPASTKAGYTSSSTKPSSSPSKVALRPRRAPHEPLSGFARLRSAGAECAYAQARATTDWAARILRTSAALPQSHEANFTCTCHSCEAMRDHAHRPAPGRPHQPRGFFRAAGVSRGWHRRPIRA